MAENLLHPPRPGRRLDLSDAGRSPYQASGQAPVQLALEDVGTPLYHATFVVVDLETTGGSPAASEITEIGAVKVRGGEVLGEFQTLVNPGVGIPPMITVLTGITNAMVIEAPPIAEVLPAFLEFAHGAVLVAHNARFDVGFLKAAAARMDLSWPRPQVVDTVALARRVVTRDEAPNHKLGTLAALFHAETTPDHRALSDARATVDVLHALLARMSGLGVTHLEDLTTAADPVPHARRRKSTLADGLPTGAGVYQFLGPKNEVLYVGTAVNIKRRVRSYFTAAEKRARIGEMVDLATGVRPIPCATPLEASVRELRLIAEHKPPYNRRSRAPERRPWIRLTDEAHPRLSIVRSVPVAARDRAIGPFASRRGAELATEAILATVPLRQCTARLPRLPAPGASACVLAELGRCAAPCVTAGGVVEPGLPGVVSLGLPGIGAERPHGVLTPYPVSVATAASIMGGDAGPVVAALRRSIGHLSLQQRYEEAAVHRDRLLAFLRGAARTQRLAPVQRARQIVAARAHAEGGWEIVVVRYGRLAATAISPRDTSPYPTISALLAGAEQVAQPDVVGGAATAEETELITGWLERPGARLIEFDAAESPGWALPVGGATAHLRELEAAQTRDTERAALGRRAGEHPVIPAADHPEAPASDHAAPTHATRARPAAG
ncbi:DEDD exonuclease domain-containing protein [Occultella glacieicola]|uniref:DEDD exonuclease domain-containing protein n=1 Tax=Occultella glacieicola TaxID=2518684 RepID=A0ABY2DXU6_9MICO|nr:DEDD exonuclease domain-containing protein [Occultella glacieicola]TDE88957.1 DEDD exonuclease domain-containing protein [Occultella glacieicola]